MSTARSQYKILPFTRSAGEMRRGHNRSQAGIVRLQKGQQLVELATGLIVLIPIILVLIDLVIIMMAINLNDHACRDAARVAAAGRPTIAEIENRAKAALKTYKGGGYVVGPNYISAKGINVTPDPTAPPATGGPYQGDVEVNSTVVVNLPVSIPGITPTQMTCTSTQRFPISFVEPVSSTYTPPQ